ncbi:FAD/FMN-containing isoamyl alcohol oxidase-like protein MreA [Ascobolus immersus RN42]|uniref:FAD/FMN-containing isoamyl alcohol oxidase-like protein MreA n=1 Tax=Ascobolus immersus RN42 TaxID=1160509 RepID=A0A3N4HPU0_ASCIM|nr:FAD/FMN-containing isoamyl alcohol oxidase-like protein MreA [Ascobolus immersus RN42]
MRSLAIISVLPFLANSVSAAVAAPTQFDKYLLPADEFPESRASAASKCKVIPGDKGWPSVDAWNHLNKTVDGRLIKTIPPAAACYKSFGGVNTYDAEGCAEATVGWSDQEWLFNQPGGTLWPFWSNMTCLPTEDPNSSCTLGRLPVYTIDATKAEHVQAGVNWARNHNIRLVIKNTGHDFGGKSLGASALSIWTHNFKELKIEETQAVVGSGWQAGDLYAELHKKKKVVVGGECAGVGITGGFIQGGGNGPLSPLYGMASDHALSFKVVTADGKIVTANKDKNSDLYWALRGGGGGTFGVVLSVTMRIFPDLKFAGAVLNITDPSNSLDTFWKGIEIFHGQSEHWTDNDMYVYYELAFGGPTMFWSKPLLAPGKTKAQLAKILEPLFEQLDAAGVKYSAEINEYPDFVTTHNSIFDTEGVGFNMLTSGRLIHKDDFMKNYVPITKILREMATLPDGRGRVIVSHILRPGKYGVDENSGINPLWKDMITLPLWNVYVLENTPEAIQAGIDDVAYFDEKIKALTPKSGAYLNEANLFDPDWAKDMYGSKYKRLSQIKKKYDPKELFYAKTAVGSEKWVEDGARLCRA